MAQHTDSYYSSSFPIYIEVNGTYVKVLVRTNVSVCVSNSVSSSVAGSNQADVKIQKHNCDTFSQNRMNRPGGAAAPGMEAKKKN